MRVLPICSALLLGISLSLPALAQCTVRQLLGSAEWQRGSAPFKPLRSGQTLLAGDELRTGAKSRVRLACVDGSSLVLADDSRLRIERFEAAKEQPRWASFWLKRGLVEQQVSPSPGGRWQVRTPSAVTAVRGTRFLLELDAQQRTLVQVSEGEVAVAPLPPAVAASEGDADYASKALAAVVPALLVSMAQPALRCGAVECLPAPLDPKQQAAWRKRLGR